MCDRVASVGMYYVELEAKLKKLSVWSLPWRLFWPVGEISTTRLEKHLELQKFWVVMDQGVSFSVPTY